MKLLGDPAQFTSGKGSGEKFGFITADQVQKEEKEEEDESSAVNIELVEDPDSDSNTDISGDPAKENKEEGATFYFSGGGEPTTDTSVYKTSRELVMAILKDHSAPTLFRNITSITSLLLTSHLLTLLKYCTPLM